MSDKKNELGTGEDDSATKPIETETPKVTSADLMAELLKLGESMRRGYESMDKCIDRLQREVKELDVVLSEDKEPTADLSKTQPKKKSKKGVSISDGELPGKAYWAKQASVEPQTVAETTAPEVASPDQAKGVSTKGSGDSGKNKERKRREELDAYLDWYSRLYHTYYDVNGKELKRPLSDYDEF